MEEDCVYCGEPADGECLDCRAPICAACSSEEEELLCDDADACEERMDRE